MARVIWKGAVSFGLVHIPVSLVPATVQRGVDFDWLDKRSMDPVGYKRINKVTGEAIESKDIVRGVQYEKNRYVVLSDDEIRSAYPKATQTVDIIAFVKAEQIPLLYIDTPYYLSPEGRGEKAYALLREALEKTGRIALANVVMHTKQHLAAVMPLDNALVLNTLRWGDEVRSVEELALKKDAVEGRLAPRELEMATRLIEDMSEDWDPSHYKSEFVAQIMELVERKASQGKLENVGPVGEEAEETGAEIVDLTELLKRSLGKERKQSKSGDEEKTSPASRKARAKTKTG